MTNLTIMVAFISIVASFVAVKTPLYTRITESNHSCFPPKERLFVCCAQYVSDGKAGRKLRIGRRISEILYIAGD